MSFATRFSPPVSPSMTFAPDSSRTRQEFKSEADVNELVNRFSETGSFYDPLTAVKSSERKPMFGDFTSAVDYQSACDIVLLANSRFEALPSKVRERFGNDPASLLAFLDNPENRAEAISLGLLSEPPSEPAEPPSEPPPAS